ncbi:MAG: hypothetical protein ABI593_02675 [Betaproteobacteria bacterium]
MKRFLTLLIAAAVLGGCAIVPLGPRYYNDGYSRGHGGYRGDGYYRNDGYRNDGYRNYGYRNDGYRNYGPRDYGYGGGR